MRTDEPYDMRIVITADNRGPNAPRMMKMICKSPGTMVTAGMKKAYVIKNASKKKSTSGLNEEKRVGKGNLNVCLDEAAMC